MIVALSFERYFTYCHPEKAKWLCTRTVAKIVVILLTIFSILCTIPVFMEHEWNFDGTVQEASIRKNTFYEKSIRAWMNSATRFFIPTLCLLIFNYQIMKKVSCLPVTKSDNNVNFYRFFNQPNCFGRKITNKQTIIVLNLMNSLCIFNS